MKDNTYRYHTVIITKMRNLYLNILTMLIVISFNSCHDYTAKKGRIEKQFLKANAYYMERDFKSALSIFDSLIKKDSLNGEIYYKRGYCKAQILDPRTSKEDFENAIKFGYRVKDSYLNLGVIECFYNDSLAIKYFDIVLSIDSADIKAKTFREEAIKRLDFYNKNMEL